MEIRGHIFPAEFELRDGGAMVIFPRRARLCAAQTPLMVYSLSENVAAGILACRGGRHLAARKNHPQGKTLKVVSGFPGCDAFPPGCPESFRDTSAKMADATLFRQALGAPPSENVRPPTLTD
jgi:hypothetical protein